jgi:hypothetical protein
MSAVSWADERVAESPQPVLAKRRRSVKQPTCPHNSKPTPAVQVGKESVYEFDADEAREEPKKKLKKLKAEPKVKVVKASKENLVDKVNKPKVRKGGPQTPVHDDDDDEDEEDEEDTPTLRVRRKGTTPKGMVFKSL